MEAQVAGGEVELFIVSRIVRDVHFAVATSQCSISLEHDRGVVIKTAGSPFENGTNDDHPELSGD